MTAKIEISTLTLPDGWVADDKVWPGGMIIALQAPAPTGGIVTVDFERRCFDGGYGRPTATKLPSTGKKYAGRGWQAKLVRDAVQWLVSVMT